MRFRRYLMIIIACMLSLPILARRINSNILLTSSHPTSNSILLPYPHKLELQAGVFKWKNMSLSADFLEGDYTKLIVSNGGKIHKRSKRILKVSKVDRINEAGNHQEEAYVINISPKCINVQSVTELGAYRALQTLEQLLLGQKYNKTNSSLCIKCCDIVDWAAFRIRGFMQDVGRSWISIEELKQEINKLSKYKINTFHWHLTENQAWRLESKIYPMLNDSTNVTRYKGKFYTLEEAKDLVDFCKERRVLLIPEIDMPGHSAAFERTFHHSMQSPEGKKILKQLLDEVCDTFDVPYLHIGTDEVQFVDPDFVPEMVSYIRAKGKKVISWNPGWKYKPGEIDMTQLWSSRGVAQKGIPAIDSRFHYLNHFDTFGDLFANYSSKIYNQDEGNEDIAGAIMAIWNDRFIPNEKDIIRQNHLYPNMLALAERSWLGGGWQYFDKCGTIIPSEQTPEFEAFADFERRLLWHKEHVLYDCPISYVRQTNVKWSISEAFPNGGDLTSIFPPEEGEWKDSFEYDGKVYGTKEAIGAGIYLRHVWGTFVPSFYKNPEENHTAYAHTWVYSPKNQEVGMWIEFQNYSRSEKDLPPRQGEWDYRKSRIWLNKNEILPPIWSTSYVEHNNELPLGNENCVVRKPILVQLNKGWNEVLIKLPVGRFRVSETRLVKWMFTTVFVTPDGQSELKNIIYSPSKGK